MITLNQPAPIPVSVFASLTFFMYAMTGPLCDASITSFAPEVRLCRHVSVALEPACTVMTVLVFEVGFGPPLHAMSLEVTSWMGCQRYVSQGATSNAVSSKGAGV